MVRGTRLFILERVCGRAEGRCGFDPIRFRLKMNHNGYFASVCGNGLERNLEDPE